MQPRSTPGSSQLITTTLATWDTVWEVNLDLKWAWQRLGLYGVKDQALQQFFKKLGEPELSREHHKYVDQLVVFFNTAGCLSMPAEAAAALASLQPMLASWSSFWA
ncbi:hypothetical protein HaLaN_24242, partial [Haematococcus lacustris]